MFLKTNLSDLWKKSSDKAERVPGLSTEMDCYLGSLERKIKKLKYNKLDKDYYQELFDGLLKYFSKWAYFKEEAKSALMKRSDLFHETLLAGREIQDKFSTEEELFFLGLFIDLKINEMWAESSFWMMVTKAFKKFVSSSIKFGAALKKKIIEQYKKVFPDEIERIALMIFQYDLLVTHISPSRTGRSVT